MIYEWDTEHFDCAVLLGDIISNEFNGAWYGPHFNDLEYHNWTRFKRDYTSRLDSEGIPFYLVYANHEDLTDEHFASFFPYTKDFLLNVGDDSFVCIDSFWDPNQTPEVRKWGYGGLADAKDGFLEFCDGLVKDKDEVFICSHYIDPKSSKIPAFFERHENIVCGIEGHTHVLAKRRFGKFGEREFNVYDIGQFSWTADTWGIVNEETIQEHIDSGDMSPMCQNFYYVVVKEDEEGTEVQQFPVFAQINYGITYGRGERHPKPWIYDAFSQPRFLGSDSFKIDASARIRIKNCPHGDFT